MSTSGMMARCTDECAPAEGFKRSTSFRFSSKHTHLIKIICQYWINEMIINIDLHNDSEIYLVPKPIRWGFITFMDSSGASEALSAFQSRGSDFFRLADFNLRSLVEC